MKIVQPIRDIDKVEEMKAYFKSRNTRNYIMFLLGISVGLRISDILKLKKEDLLKSHIDIMELKTTKRKRVKIPGYLKKEFISYANTLNDDEYIIKSRQGTNRPICRTTAYRILRDAADHVKLKEIGTHTLRKTFGYHFYKQTNNIAMLMELFNHADQETTLRYIGIAQDALDDAMDKYRI